MGGPYITILRVYRNLRGLYRCLMQLPYKVSYINSVIKRLFSFFLGSILSQNFLSELNNYWRPWKPEVLRPKVLLYLSHVRRLNLNTEFQMGFQIFNRWPIEFDRCPLQNCSRTPYEPVISVWIHNLKKSSNVQLEQAVQEGYPKAFKGKVLHKT